jgi:hypothetical protein
VVVTTCDGVGGGTGGSCGVEAGDCAGYEGGTGGSCAIDVVSYCGSEGSGARGGSCVITAGPEGCESNCAIEVARCLVRR